MDKDLFTREVEDLITRMEETKAEKLSELAKVAGLDLQTDFVGFDFSGEDLSNDILRGANFKGANFSNANLSGTDLSGANLEGANFSGANLEGTNLEGANLKSVDLSKAISNHEEYKYPIGIIEVGKTTSNPITGTALLQKVKELANLPRRETARLCGYYSVSKEGQTRVSLTDFYDAVLAAKGVNLDDDHRKRQASFRVSVHKNGQIVIGSAYTEKMHLKPGDEFEIKLRYKEIYLKLVEPQTDLGYLHYG
jgi:AbrB family looped-hinge helix DNA binding protein